MIGISIRKTEKTKFYQTFLEIFLTCAKSSYFKSVMTAFAKRFWGSLLKLILTKYHAVIMIRKQHCGIPYSLILDNCHTKCAVSKANNPIAVTESFTHKSKTMFLFLHLRLYNYWKMAIRTNLMIYRANRYKISALDKQIHNSLSTKT